MLWLLCAFLGAAEDPQSIYNDIEALMKDLRSAGKLNFGERLEIQRDTHFDSSKTQDKDFIARCATLLQRATMMRDGLAQSNLQDSNYLVYVESFTHSCVRHGDTTPFARYEERLTMFSNDRHNTAAKSKARGRREMRKVKDEFYDVLTKEFKPELQRMIAENSHAEDKAVMAIVESLEKSVSEGTQPGDLNLIEFWKTFRSAPSQKFTDIKHVIKEFYRMKPLVEEALDKSGVISDKYRGNAQERDFDIVEGSMTTGGRVFTLNRDTTEFARLDMLDLLMHEANPGHHLERWYYGQLDTNVPPFMKEIRRRFAMTNAFTEGWAHYIERFILDEPAFKTAYLKQFSERDFIFQKLGTFQWLMFRCARLIVDPLLNENGQNPSTAVREDAIAIMMDSGISLTFAKAQVLRYLRWPGQATSYLSGALIIRRLRRASGMTAATFHGKVLNCFGLVAALPACIGVELPPEETSPAGTSSSSTAGISPGSTSSSTASISPGSTSSSTAGISPGSTSSSTAGISPGSTSSSKSGVNKSSAGSNTSSGQDFVIVAAVVVGLLALVAVGLLRYYVSSNKTRQATPKARPRKATSRASNVKRPPLKIPANTQKKLPSAANQTELEETSPRISGEMAATNSFSLISSDLSDISLESESPTPTLESPSAALESPVLTPESPSSQTFEVSEVDLEGEMPTDESPPSEVGGNIDPAATLLAPCAGALQNIAPSPAIPNVSPSKSSRQTKARISSSNRSSPPKSTSVRRANASVRPATTPSLRTRFPSVFTALVHLIVPAKSVSTRQTDLPPAATPRRPNAPGLVAPPVKKKGTAAAPAASTRKKKLPAVAATAPPRAPTGSAAAKPSSNGPARAKLPTAKGAPAASLRAATLPSLVTGATRLGGPVAGAPPRQKSAKALGEITGASSRARVTPTATLRRAGLPIVAAQPPGCASSCQPRIHGVCSPSAQANSPAGTITASPGKSDAPKASWRQAKLPAAAPFTAAGVSSRQMQMPAIVQPSQRRTLPGPRAPPTQSGRRIKTASAPRGEIGTATFKRDGNLAAPPSRRTPGASRRNGLAAGPSHRNGSMMASRRSNIPSIPSSKTAKGIPSRRKAGFSRGKNG